MYLLSTFSIIFCWKRPLMISWLFPSIEPLQIIQTKPNQNYKERKSCNKICVKYVKWILILKRIQTPWLNCQNELPFFKKKLAAYNSAAVVTH